MMQSTGLQFTDYLLAAFYDIDHLGLSTKERFNSKIANARNLVRKYPFVGFIELHASNAVAQDTFFGHLLGTKTLYHCPPGYPGMALSI